ncbi:MAG: glycosyltransferase, partial [Oscillospiraceae bacterium]|nr:glycosyltransferase [Oscillospiraceae bacterium]
PDGFDGYFVFDADNILAPDYIECMDRTFREGHDIVTSYRNSTNYGANWISAGYALWFLHESEYLNHARHLLGLSCAVGGTGFMFSREIADEMNGWPYHTLTEDIEFSIANITRGRKIAFCPEAELFDEQPVTFRQSWRQRLRWAKGYYQVFGIYGGRLLKGALRGSFSCYDMAASNLPALIATVISMVTGAVSLTLAAINGTLAQALVSALQALLGTYLTLFFLGGLTTVTEWRKIRATPAQKLIYAFTFPVFMLTYIPISLAALFAKPEWKPIIHVGGFTPDSGKKKSTYRAA